MALLAYALFAVYLAGEAVALQVAKIWSQVTLRAIRLLAGSVFFVSLSLLIIGCCRCGKRFIAGRFIRGYLNHATSF